MVWQKQKTVNAKQELIKQLLQMYEINSCEDIEEALKDLLGSTIKGMLEAELSEHLGYEKSARGQEKTNYRNGYKTKKNSIHKTNRPAPENHDK